MGLFRVTSLTTLFRILQPSQNLPDLKSYCDVNMKHIHNDVIHVNNSFQHQFIQNNSRKQILGYTASSEERDRLTSDSLDFHLPSRTNYNVIIRRKATCTTSVDNFVCPYVCKCWLWQLCSS